MVFFEHYCIIKTTLHRFSSCDRKDSVSAEYDCNDECFKHYFAPRFYANGNCIENDGHVSIIFYLYDTEFDSDKILRSRKFVCVASVIDASGNKRFPQSFVLDHCSRSEKDMVFFMKGFGFNRYVKRSTLLSNSSELLPDDSLTLCLEIDYELRYLPIRVPKDCTCDGLHVENDKCYLRTDTEFARDVYDMSTILHMCKRDELIFDSQNEPELEGTLSEIRYLYVYSYFYAFQQAIEFCHQLLISMLHARIGKDILRMIYSDLGICIRDEILKEIYSYLNRELEGETRELDAPTDIIQETEWSCEVINGTDDPTFLFKRIKRKFKYSQFEFYK